MSNLIDKLQLLLGEPLRTSDIKTQLPPNRFLLATETGNKGITFEQAKEIGKALGVFKKTIKGTINKKTITNENINHLLEALIPFNRINLVPKEFLDMTPSIKDRPITTERQKKVLENRKVDAVTLGFVKEYIEDINDIRMLHSFKYHVTSPEDITQEKAEETVEEPETKALETETIISSTIEAVKKIVPTKAQLKEGLTVIKEEFRKQIKKGSEIEIKNTEGAIAETENPNTKIEDNIKFARVNADTLKQLKSETKERKKRLAKASYKFPEHILEQTAAKRIQGYYAQDNNIT
ncbi:MAG: hypothetical protein KDJ35_06825 [Alphaproteobacteria bacterium]|nr:hypothetical protein [Alphaproteobacteria bacterium]